MGVAAVMVLPAIAYASRTMSALTIRHAPAQKRLVAIGSSCLRGACLGLAGLALAPQGPTFDTVHIISGVFAMGGVYMTLLFLWGAPLFTVRELSAPRLALFTISACWGVVGFLGTQGYRFFAYGELGHDLKHKSESLWLRFSLWEWMLFAAVTTSFAVLIALLPEKGAGSE
jgi:hypothetical protein